MLFLFIYAPFSAVLEGLLLAKLWQWFVVSTFHVYAISSVEAIGLSLTASFLLNGLARKKTEAANALSYVLTDLVNLFFVFLIALAVVQFI